ncbi:MAG: hypothetical protein ACD_57C00302G0002 [uncultured bacterium]|uniref:Uncharacterized protein n=1 Tax=Candidatus Curtissbacteria bacterium RIFOXYA1_FULL_41_14 TaxID=1797737 RepID=A0A1F5HGP9_9BACT|nr:MAG: hypothetical protein ACD_57C00302G0002 [uncultured bacterium]KKR61877.1 MAG: hypothetical protein UU00_C0006G0004 [Microgenomates group bacterium GW2011_GWC1_40_35]KKR76347.1 MAG: hypothetical protein UU19_C0030G0003 [Candidatus Curtissbacteria bacterium GW2011_GWD1_40_8]KKS02149.1 MAG: hypothetical protein UU53_C0003G0008 [Candidatus Curtissbacteria bacterium GW2011_GWC2_41_21]OGD91884.1 MAG: hypothetical protein A3E14_02080 [Candidatus Curtissbacteria bacterium RIFCSPHIGHO2_12_FULL_41
MPVIIESFFRSLEPFFPTDQARRLIVKEGGLRLLKKAVEGLKKHGAQHIMLVGETADKKYTASMYWNGITLGWDHVLNRPLVVGNAIKVISDGTSIGVSFSNPETCSGWESITDNTLPLTEKIQVALKLTKPIGLNNTPYKPDLRHHDYAGLKPLKVLLFKQ